MSAATMAWLGASLLPLAAWLYLLTFRGGFWRADQQLETQPDIPKRPESPENAPEDVPEVIIVVPARNEADVIGRAIQSLLAQDYPNPPLIVLVDDRSDDGTATIARAAADQYGAEFGSDTGENDPSQNDPDEDGPGENDTSENHPDENHTDKNDTRGRHEERHEERLCIVTGAARPDGWAGKVWAMKQGAARAAECRPTASYILFTDADIEHHPGNLRDLVAKAEADRLDLVSLMVRLTTETFWERFLIPPFVFFFAKLYPFAWVNDPTNATAAAAGGCMLVRRATLETRGGLDALHDALIDDCALARLLKGGPTDAGRLWLGLTDKTHSIRGYDGLRGLWDMVARGAYTQLGYSPLLLAGTIFGMGMLYLAPPVLLALTVFHSVALAGLNAATWALITIAAAPTYRLYGQHWRRALCLPAAAALYTAMTVSSAWRYWRGRGGGWKGRTYSR